MSGTSTAPQEDGFENLSQDDISRIVAEMQPVASPSTDPADTAADGDGGAPPPAGSAAVEATELAEADPADADEATAGSPPAERAADADPSAGESDEEGPATPAPDQPGKDAQNDAPTETAPETADERPDDGTPVALTFEETTADAVPSPQPDAVADAGANSNDVTLREVEPQHRPRRHWAWFSVAALGLVVLGLGAALGVDALLSKKAEAPMSGSVSSSESAAGDDASSPSGPTATITDEAAIASAVAGQGIADPLQAQLDDYRVQNNGLREELLIKKGEIERLKQHYRKGIERVEAEIIEQKGRLGIKTLAQALKNKKIELALKTIQRRDLYIKSLDQPADWLLFGSEELMYHNRLVDIEMIAASVSDRVDIDQLIADGRALNQRYLIDVDKLTVELDTGRAVPIDAIWQRIVKKEKQVALSQLIPAEASQGSSAVSATDTPENFAIWEEICDGDFGRKSEMTALSTPAAKCLAYCNDTDMFLNRLSDISPETARHLLKWRGHWIGLNGLASVSPEVASYLFRWPGQWMSLNGVKTLTPSVSRHIRQWPGKRLEMMGLDFQALSAAGPQVLKDLRQWQRNGGSLYVSTHVQELLRHGG